MELLIVGIFIIGYLGITLEHSLKIDKLVPALAMMAILWAIISLFHLPVYEVNTEARELELGNIHDILLHHLGKTAEILIFLLGAMAIVELIDYFDGFSAIKTFIRTKTKTKLLWIFGFLAFILSAIIDNLTATIVLITILQKLVKKRENRIWFAGLIIIAANAGGAWSPIGDVTTTMLWISNKVTTVKLIEFLIIPSLICMAVPLFIASKLKRFKGEIEIPIDKNKTKHKQGPTMLYLGLSAIIFVPIFKTITHLPPYIGMMLSLGIVSVFAEIFSSREIKIAETSAEKDTLTHQGNPVQSALTKIEMPSILFFLGILLAVAALESLGMLFEFATILNETIPSTNIVVVLLGVASAIIDNVPLVAASIGMFPHLTDHHIWHFIAFSAGTGGSMLIIGSAAGVVAMGMEKIDFFWYLKNIAWLALIGFVSGSAAFLIITSL